MPVSVILAVQWVSKVRWWVDELYLPLPLSLSPTQNCMVLRSVAQLLGVEPHIGMYSRWAFHCNYILMYILSVTMQPAGSKDFQGQFDLRPVSCSLANGVTHKERLTSIKVTAQWVTSTLGPFQGTSLANTRCHVYIQHQMRDNKKHIAPVLVFSKTFFTSTSNTCTYPEKDQ